MPLAHKFASRLLTTVTRRCSPDSQDWGEAMLREMDFIDSDWRALLWAFGSTTALFRHSLPRQMKAWFAKWLGPAENRGLRKIRDRGVGMLWGVIMAGAVLTACVLGLLWLAPALFPGSPLWHARFVEWSAYVGIPESVFLAASVALWHKRRPVAIGVLLGAILLITHAIVHAATRG